MITPVPLTAEAFAPFGELIEADGAHVLINAGQCKRFNDLATFDVPDGELGLSFFASEVRAFPYTCDLMERHPLSSQCFVPMGGSAYLVIVAEDQDGSPGAPLVFWATGRQGINIRRNTWHGVLAPVSGSGLFGVIDRVTADGQNLEEFPLETPIVISAP